MNHILNITTQTLESSREIAHKLLPPSLNKFGLKVTLEELFDEITSNTAIKIFHDIEVLDFLSKSSELHIFRIAQELINNALNHGKATQLQMKLKKGSKGFVLIFNDNGEGFKINDDTKRPGLGLQNIKSRVSILNGKLKIESSKNTGSTLTINCHSYDI